MKLSLCEYCWFFVCDFPCQTVPISIDRNVSMLSDQNVSILIVSNMYYGNIGILWNKKFCMKSWYNSKLLWLLTIFFVCFLGIKYLDISNSHTTYISAILMMLANVSTPWILLCVCVLVFVFVSVCLSVCVCVCVWLVKKSF